MMATTKRLTEALTASRCYPHPVSSVSVIETHISWVLLTGGYAYKIKKPVNLGFLDFTTLASRRHYCGEELRLNRRLAPELYLEVVAITGTPQHPLIGGSGPAIEYAVKMKEFPQSALLGNALARGKLDRGTVEKLARKIADFHAAHLRKFVPALVPIFMRHWSRRTRRKAATRAHRCWRRRAITSSKCSRSFIRSRI